MPTKDPHQAPPMRSFRLPGPEFNGLLQRAADKAGLTVSQFIRQALAMALADAVTPPTNAADRRRREDKK